MSELAAAWTGMLVGTGSEGSGSSAAQVTTLLGDPASAVGAAWTNSLATPGGPFLVHSRPGLAIRPLTVFVPRVDPVNGSHAEVTWGAAQAGVAAGVTEAVRIGVIPADVAGIALLVCSVWVDPAATVAHSDVIFLNNRVATLTALDNAGHNRPTVAEAVTDPEGPWNQFYRP